MSYGSQCHQLKLVGESERHFLGVQRVAWLVGILVFLMNAGASAAPSFTAALDRNVVPAGESFTLNLVFESLNLAAEPALPTIQNVTVAGVSRGQSYSFANGVRTATFTLSYTLVANQPGDVTIPAISVVADGKTFTSQPIPLRIVPAAAAQAALTNLAFLRLVLSKAEVYAGEPFAVEMHFYWNNATRPDERDFRYPQLRAEGFSLGQMAKPAQTRTQIGNAIYNVIILKLTATAARTGNVTLGPAEQSFTLLIPTGRRDFFGPQLQPRQMKLTSDSVSLRVLPLPAQNVPEGFNGAIGTYQMTSDAGPTNVGVGDPITVRVQISGQGPLDALTFPPQSHWRDFNAYPPNVIKVEPTDELGLAGSKSFEQVLIPQNHEIKELPPFRFSFFDPNARGYRTLTGPVIPLTVRPTATAVVPSLSLTNAGENSAAPPAADDIVHIRPRFELTGTAPLLLSQPWFLALQGLPALAWLSLLIWRKRTESLANNPRLRRQREVAQRVRDGLRELRTCAETRESDRFFATLFRLLQEQLGERLDLPASAITEAVIDERLRGHSISEETLKSLHELFQACNLARYAPVQSSHELAAFIPKTETTLRDLQKLSA